MRTLILALAIFAAPAAHAQLNNPPAAVIPADVARLSDVSMANAAAANAKAAADAAALAAAAACQPGSIVPPMETVGGFPGSGDACRLANSVQPRISRVVVGTTVTGGTATVTWPVMTAVPSVFPIPRIASTATQAPACYPVAGSITTTGATIKCFTTQTVTVALLGAVVAPITTAAAGVVFDVLAIPQS